MKKFIISALAFSFVAFFGATSAVKAETKIDCKYSVDERDYTSFSTNLPTRNNNPSNIRKTGRSYHGETVSDNGFEKFVAPEWGFAAQFDLLDRLYSGLDLNAAIHKWAPPVENNTKRYVSYVEKNSLADAMTVIDVHEPVMIQSIVMAMAQHEGFKGFNTGDIRRGYALWESCY